MSDQFLDSGVPTHDEMSKPRLLWEVPEIAGVSILAAVGSLVLGGLATGVARIVQIEQPFTGAQVMERH